MKRLKFIQVFVIVPLTLFASYLQGKLIEIFRTEEHLFEGGEKLVEQTSPTASIPMS